jgi:hypothetical protein
VRGGPQQGYADGRLLSGGGRGGEIADRLSDDMRA